MIINFTKKVRRLVGIFMVLSVILGSGICLYKRKNSVQTLNAEETNSINKYIMDV